MQEPGRVRLRAALASRGAEFPAKRELVCPKPRLRESLPAMSPGCARGLYELVVAIADGSTDDVGAIAAILAAFAELSSK